MSKAGSHPGCPPFSLTRRSHLEQDLREGRIPKLVGFAAGLTQLLLSE